MKVVYLSQILGGYDGVSIEAAKWIEFLEADGHEVTRVAGHFGDVRPRAGTDLRVDSLWRPNAADPWTPRLAASVIEQILFAGRGGVAVFDNLATLPSAPDSTTHIMDALVDADIPVLIRHHDP